jgi:mercuric ion transport protein
MSNAEGRAKRLSIGGALLAALAASSCCVVPLLLAALGVGGAGAVAALGAYRPYLLGATAALLVAGFYFTYRRPRVAEGDSCGCARPRASRAGRLALWIATVVVVLVAASPPLLARWAERQMADAASDPTLAHDTIHVEGIDCEACAAPIRKALAKAGGLRDVRLDVSKQSVLVSYERAPGRLEAYVAAINELGYEASLPSRPRT